MTVTRSATPEVGPAGVLRHPAAWSWWAQALTVYLATRVVSAVVLLAVARTQAANLWTPESPSYSQYTGFMWDASWYRQIAEQGYPTTLPVGVDGAVHQNALAFFPLFPTLARGLMGLTGLGWEVVAPTLALLLGVGAALCLHRVVALATAGRSWADERVRAWLPAATVAVLGVWGAAPVLQVAYTESLALLLLTAAMLCLLRRRYGATALLVVALGLTRAVALPFAVVVLAHGVARLRDPEGFPLGDRVRVAGLAVVAGVSGFLWPYLVGLRTGDATAYTRTQATWRGSGDVVPFAPWVSVTRWRFGDWWPLVLIVAAALAVVAVRAAWRLGPELGGWTGGYFAYLVAVIEPGTSLVRFGVLAFPVAAAAAAWALRRHRWALALAALLVVGVASEVAWVACLWRLVPPSGWPP